MKEGKLFNGFIIFILLSKKFYCFFFLDLGSFYIRPFWNFRPQVCDFVNFEVDQVEIEIH
jgi:hypothetical protein